MMSASADVGFPQEFTDGMRSIVGRRTGPKQVQLLQAKVNLHLILLAKPC